MHVLSSIFLPFWVSVFFIEKNENNSKPERRKLPRRRPWPGPQRSGFSPVCLLFLLAFRMLPFCLFVCFLYFSFLDSQP